MTGIPRFESYQEELRDEHGAPASRIFTISGLTGSGTSTIADFIAGEFDLERVNAGQFFRDQAAQRDMDIQEFDKHTEEIERREGIDFDLQWDRTALSYAYMKDEFLLEGRLAGALLYGIAPVRIWVACNPSVVAERIASREDKTSEQAEEYVRTRNLKVLERYTHKYHIDPRNKKFYNVTVDNTNDLATVKEDLLDRIATILD